jgi:hypothetical protein
VTCAALERIWAGPFPDAFTVDGGGVGQIVLLDETESRGQEIAAKKGGEPKAHKRVRPK